MTSVARPTMLSYPSSQSSPPPSPVAASSPSLPTEHLRGEQVASQPLDIGTSPGLNKTPTRPRLPGRQETPPSPPNSVMLLGDHSPISPAMQNASSSVGPVSQRTEHGDPEDSTPPASLKQRITRVFKVGHRRGESNLSRSTNSTDDTIQQDPVDYLPSPVKENIKMHPNKSNFYTRQPTAPTRSNSHSNNGSTRRRVMNGGEVRVEILPHPSLVGNSTNYGNTREDSPKREQDGSDLYYKYYTRSSRDADEEFYEDEEGEIRRSHPGSEEDLYLPPLNRQGVSKTSPQRSQTVSTQGASEGQNRRYAEESISFGFEGFHIGNGSCYSNGAFAGLSNPSSPTFSTGVGIYSSSGKASSSVLNYLNQSDLNMLSREPSARTTPVSGKSSSGVGRPGMSRNASSASYFSPGMRRVSSGPGRSGSPQLDEAITRELKRLSKISAGSGASGFAMVVTTDGSVSTKIEDFSDEEMDTMASERKFTKEEKGKGRAVSSTGTESAAERKAGDSRNGYRTGHQHTISDASKFIRSDGSEGSSDNGNSDGMRLLQGVDGGSGRRKLKSQEVPKGVLVHNGDTRYDFVYRMRQTSDATPILVPQYFYPADGFPNRNALTAPVRAKLSPLAPINTSNIGVMSFPGQYGSSHITMPENAAKRSPDSTSSFYIRKNESDQAVDSRDGSPLYPDYGPDGFDSHHGPMTHALGENKTQSLVHPALRSPGQQPAKNGRHRPVVSLGSLEGIAGFELGRLVTGTPNGTGRRLAGSSLADDSDMSNRLEDSPGKRSKGVRMGGVDGIDFIPPLQQNTTASYHRAESKVWIAYRTTRLPTRPKNLRRSMTPRLYDPRPLGDSWKDLSNYDAEAMRNEPHNRAYRMEKRVSRIILALCLLFPPLLLLAAMGSFDTMVDGWTDGEVKGVGRTEKKIAAVVGSLFAVGAVVGGVAAAVLVAT